LDILGKTVFNHDFGRLDGKNDKYYQAYKTIMRTTNHPLGLLLRMIPQMEKFPMQWIKDYLNSVDTLVNFFSQMLQEHKDDNSILGNLMMGSELENKDQALSKEELLANVWIFFLAGHETTASALTWALNCLREYPDIQEKLHQEIKEKFGSD